MKNFNPLTSKQKEELLGLFYWYQQLKWALHTADKAYEEICHKNVKFNIECCDKVQVPWVYQNAILTRTTRHSTYDEFVNHQNMLVQG